MGTPTLKEAVEVLEDVAAGGLSASEESHQEWVDARRVVFGEDDEVVVAHDIVRDCGPAVHRPTTRELLDEVVESLADLQRRFDAAPEPDAAPSLVIGCKEAARLLGIRPAALYARVARGQVPGVIRTGRTIGFLRSKLEAGLSRRAR